MGFKVLIIDFFLNLNDFFLDLGRNILFIFDFILYKYWLFVDFIYK